MDNVTIIIVLFLVIGGFLITTNQVSGNSYLILTILLVIALFIFVMNLSMFKSYTQVLDSASDANVASTMDGSKYTQKSVEYSISTWIYISDWSTKDGKPKIIMSRGDNPSLVLDSFKNDLLVNFQTFNTDKTGGEQKQVRIPNISIQKWVNITVCFGNKNVDTYINGKLINTYVTSNSQFITITPKASTPASFSITPDGGFSGSISQCRYYDKLLTPKDAWDIYNSGVNSNFLNQYSASFKFYNNKDGTEFWIF